ncbi:glycosyltransferase [Candidatus Pacearchaeota archaeon]|nr:glycosyltransferase [Candidatus Pacearchaeota archaeon]
MKVKIVTTYPPTKCGMADHSKYLVDSLKKTGIEPEIVEIKKPSSKNPFYFIKLAKEAIKNTSKEDVIHIEFHLSLFGKLFGILPGFYITLFLMWLKIFGSAKVVITMHDSSKKSDAKLLGRKAIAFYYYYQFIAPFLKHFSDKMIFHSEFGKEIAVKEWKFDKNKIDVIPLGSPMSGKQLNKNACKKKLGYSDKKILLILGYIKEARDYEMVLKALAKLDKEVILLIAGQIQLKKHKVIQDKILEDVKKLKLEKRVKLLGFVEDKDLPVLLNATDIGIIPYSRTFGDFTSAATAVQLAYQVPTLSTNLLPFEDFKKKKKCIETYDRENILDLVKKIKDLLDNPSKTDSLKKYCKIYWEDTNWDVVGRKTKEFYLSLFKQKLNGISSNFRRK